MRILCQQSVAGNASVHEGWGRVFAACGHEFTIWEPSSKPAFDAFDELNPDLFISDGVLGRAVGSCLSERKSLRVLTVDSPSPAGDTSLYCDGMPSDHLACDFAYVGNYREDKKGFLDRYLGPIAGQGDSRTKIFGREPYPSVEYLGSASDRTVRDLYASARVSLNISATGRTPERVFRIMLAGGVCVSTDLTDGVIPEGLFPSAPTPPTFLKLALTIAESDTRKRRKLSEHCRRFVLDGHTYWHRCRDMLAASGFDGDAHRVMEVYRAAVRV